MRDRDEKKREGKEGGAWYRDDWGRRHSEVTDNRRG